MKKKLLGIIVVMLFIGIIIGGIFLGGNYHEENVIAFSFTEDIIVKDSVAENEKTVIPFTLEEDGTYVMYANWNTKKAGMITGLAVRNQADEIVFCVTGESVEAQSIELKLEAGEYKAQYFFFTNDKDLKQLVEESGAVVYDNEEYVYAVNETYEIDYNFNIERAEGHNIWLSLGVLAGVLVGILLVAIILKITKTDGSIECKYDERQLQARGDGFKYGFFTMIIFNGLLSLLYIADIEIPVEKEVLLILGVLIGTCVYAVYCIHKEAYISLNENASRLKICFILTGLLNLIIGLKHCFSGDIIENGILTFRSINLLCGIFLLFITVFLSVRVKESVREED